MQWGRRKTRNYSFKQTFPLCMFGENALKKEKIKEKIVYRQKYWQTYWKTFLSHLLLSLSRVTWARCWIWEEEEEGEGRVSSEGSGWAAIRALVWWPIPCGGRVSLSRWPVTERDSRVVSLFSLVMEAPVRFICRGCFGLNCLVVIFEQFCKLFSLKFNLGMIISSLLVCNNHWACEIVDGSGRLLSREVEPLFGL